MKYMMKFAADGRYTAARPVDMSMTAERQQALLMEGYVEVDEADWLKYTGNAGKGANGTGYVYDVASGKPVDAQGNSLEQVQSMAINRLKATRDQLERVPLVYGDNLLDVDPASRIRLTTAQQAIKATQVAFVNWTTADNKIVSLKNEDFDNIIVALAERSAKLHDVYNQLKASILSCTTVEEVNAVTWPAGVV